MPRIKSNFYYFGLFIVISLLIASCGGGGGSSSSTTQPTSPPANNEIGKISGTIESEPGEDLGRTMGRRAEQSLSGVKVYAFPENTSLKLLTPNNSRPYAATSSSGAFTIENVPVGNQILVVDADADGIADERIFGVVVNKNQTTNTGQSYISNKNVDPLGSWCDIILDKVNYAPGETIVMTLKGYNFGSYSIKCGVRIDLLKGQGKTEVWRSSFTDSSTYITISANKSTSQEVRKIIPDTWSPTDSQSGSDYRVYTIRENGEIWSKGDNFNIQCASVCTTASACDDGNVLTTDICANAGSCGASCQHVTGCTPDCNSNTDCDDSNTLTIDTCNNAATCDAACTHTTCNVACGTDTVCNDGNAATTDLCLNSGTCDATCVNTPCTVACSSNAVCDDGNALTTDTCNEPGTCFSYCGHTSCTPVCNDDSACYDGNAATTDTCVSPGTCAASCVNTPCMFACSSDAGCDDSDPVTFDFCINPSTCQSSCTHRCSDLSTSSEYFPLAIGDVWNYNKSEYSPSMDTTVAETTRVTGCQIIDNEEYYALSNCFWLFGSAQCYLRYDNTQPGKVYFYLTEYGYEKLFIDMNAAQGTMLSGTVIETAVCTDENGTLPCVLNGNKYPLSVTTPYNDITDCRAYDVGTYLSDGGYLIWVCRGVGVSQAYFSSGIDLPSSFFRLLSVE